jgi:cytochrome c5
LDSPRVFSRASRTPGLVIFAALLIVGWAWPGATHAQRRERLGDEVVNAACASCHATGKEGAPKIGDQKAWAARASQGLTSLTEHALKGIRNMPAHGGAAGVSDIEIERAIVAMVNRSGGRWIEPIGGATQAGARQSEQVVQAQCAKCHQAGTDGAPKIGDRAAWIPRLKKGLDVLVASAVHGHGAMPARGGLPDLSDQEIRDATMVMVNFGTPMAKAPPPSVAPNDPRRRLVDGTEVYFGIVSAEQLRAAQKEGRPGAAMLGSIPSGKDVYHVSITLVDAKTQVPVTNAEVKARVGTAARAEIKAMELEPQGTFASYGQYFELGSADLYTVRAQIRRPDMPAAIEASFDYRPR